MYKKVVVLTSTSTELRLAVYKVREYILRKKEGGKPSLTFYFVRLHGLLQK